MNAELAAVVADARGGSEETWEVGPVTARDAVRFAAASGDETTLRRLQRGDRAAPALLLSSMLDWGAGTELAAVRADGLSPREAPFAGGHDVRLVHGGQALHWYRPVMVDDDRILATRRVIRADHRAGRSGELVVLELETRYVSPAGPVATCTEAMLVLPADGGQHGEHRPAPSVDPEARADVGHTVSTTALARFSAVTWNTHRIHIDEQFARSEGFAGPVLQSSVHGVTLLRAAEHASGAECPPVALSWRNLAAAVAGERMRAAAEDDGRGGWDVVEWADDGVVTARGHVRFRRYGGC